MSDGSDASIPNRANAAPAAGVTPPAAAPSSTSPPSPSSTSPAVVDERTVRQRIARIVPFFRDSGRGLLLALAGAIVGAATEPMIPALMKPLLDAGFQRGALPLWLIPIAVIGLFTVRGAAGFVSQYGLAWAANRGMVNLRRAMFARLLDAQPALFTRHSASSLVNTVTFEVQNGANQLVYSLQSLVRDSLTFVALFGYLLWLNWQLTLFVLVLGPAVVFVMRTLSRRLHRLTVQSQGATDELAYVVEENVLAWRIVRLHGAQPLQARRFATVSDTLRQLTMKSTVASATMTPLTQMLAAIAMSAVIVAALWQSGRGGASVGTFVAFVIAMLQLVAPIKHLSEVAGPITRAMAALDRGVALVDQVPPEAGGTFGAGAAGGAGDAVAASGATGDAGASAANGGGGGGDAVMATGSGSGSGSGSGPRVGLGSGSGSGSGDVAIGPPAGTVAAPSVVRSNAKSAGRIELRHLSLRYPGAETAALDGVSLLLQPGETVALVGPSGAGKSTLVNLLPRFIEPTGGTLLLDDRPLADWDLHALRRQFALVSQDVVLFNDSVAANVALGGGDGKGGARDRAGIEQALRDANLWDFVSALPQGIDTSVGHNGSRLSGGQRQRLAIARAIHKQATVLILDEATSALDSESERLVQDALQRLMHGRTSLVIAHRLSTIERADRIVVLDAGRVVEQGTHAELLARRGLYARLHALQFRG